MRKRTFGQLVKRTISAVMSCALIFSAPVSARAETIPETSVFCETEAAAREALISSVSRISDTECHDIYLIAEMPLTGTCLKEIYGTEIEYSHAELFETEVRGSHCKVHRFRVRRVRKDSCLHKYEIIADIAPDCSKRGMLWYRCASCGAETTVYSPPAGHADENADGICDVCEMDVHTPAKTCAWYVGDKVTETIHEKKYTFTCVDEDYVDCFQNHTHSALFLCDDVIPASAGGEYREEDDGTGHLTKVWYPGPIAEFGTNNNYKTSAIRAFLETAETNVAVPAEIGTRTAYTGETTAGKFSQLEDVGLSAFDIGCQIMTAKLFPLSLEEAITYREHLWSFGGNGEEDPQSMLNGTCTGYWLRTPCGTKADYDETDLEYIVDLTRGNIRPASIRPQSSTGDPYVDTQTTIGIRPTFLLKNN